MFFFQLFGVIRKHLDWITLGFLSVSWLSGHIERLRFVLSIPEAFYLPLSKQIHVYSCISEVTWQT